MSRAVREVDTSSSSSSTKQRVPEPGDIEK